MPLGLPLESWKWLYEALIYVYVTINNNDNKILPTAMTSGSLPCSSSHMNPRGTAP